MRPVDRSKNQPKNSSNPDDLLAKLNIPDREDTAAKALPDYSKPEDNTFCYGHAPEKLHRHFEEPLMRALVRRFLWIKTESENSIACSKESYPNQVRYIIGNDAKVKLKELFPKILSSELQAMGFEPQSDGQYQARSPFRFQNYWRSHFTKLESVIFGAPEFKLIGAETPNHRLDEKDLLKAIPDHMGHGHSRMIIDQETALEMMRKEGESDRQAARELWQLMTDVWTQPNVTTLNNLMLRYKSCGEWASGIIELEKKQRGIILPVILDWTELCFDLRVLRKSYDNYSNTRDGFDLPELGSPEECLMWNSDALADILSCFIEDGNLMSCKRNESRTSKELANIYIENKEAIITARTRKLFKL